MKLVVILFAISVAVFRAECGKVKRAAGGGILSQIPGLGGGNGGGIGNILSSLLNQGGGRGGGLLSGLTGNRGGGLLGGNRGGLNGRNGRTNDNFNRNNRGGNRNNGFIRGGRNGNDGGGLGALQNIGKLANGLKIIQQFTGGGGGGILGR